MADFFGQLLKVRFTPLPPGVNVIRPLFITAGKIGQSETTDSVQLSTVGIGVTAGADALTIQTASASNKAIIARGFAAQTENLIEVQDSASATLVSIEADGTLNLTAGFAHTGSTFGIFGQTPAAQPSAYSRNATAVESRVLLASASATTVNNNNLISAMIADLQSLGVFP